MEDIVYKEESYKIIGACFEVYKQKGFGFTEPIYQECLAIEFEIQGITFIEQPKLQLEYKGRTMKNFFKPDFICYNKIIIELFKRNKISIGFTRKFRTLSEIRIQTNCQQSNKRGKPKR